uniref:Uncharacterized protein n=1 Tax=Anguilla anguilla TaxID=7936 RepID=A0A0E9TL30_ANGAN
MYSFKLKSILTSPIRQKKSTYTIINVYSYRGAYLLCNEHRC